MIVLDASAAVELLTRAGDGAGRLADRIAPLPRVHVPELFDVEVLHALRGIERGGRLPAARLSIALSRLEGLRAERWRHQELRFGAWRLRHGLSLYDAVYVALAKLLDVPLITSDAKLATAAATEIAVELFEST